MKTKLITLITAILFAGSSCFAASYYVSPSGNDSNSGTSSSPFKTLQKAVDAVSAGDYIYLRGGTHSMTTSSIVITKNGTSSSNIHVYAYSGETPVLSFDNVENSSSRGIVMEGDYWHWQGVTIEKAGDNGMLLSGNNNTIENCIFRKNHDTGLQLSRYYTDADQISEWPSNNLIVGCEAYDNKDSDNEDADGFAAKLTCGTGNIFRSCVSHHNIDDGWDLYTKSDTGPIGIVLFEDCIAHHNGVLTDGNTSGGGDKNGFKLGSSSNTVNHELRRCIAFSNGKHGFTDNGNIGNIKFYNLTSYDNGDYNYHTRDNASHTFRNCISYDGSSSDRIVGDATESCNALVDDDYDFDYTVSSSDFQTLSQGPNSDPTSNGFLNLSSSSPLIDAGCSVSGVTGNGTLDLGAIEYGGSSTTYSLTTTIVGSGSINPSSGSYASGTSVSMTATPASGWQFDNWSGGSTSNPATVVMDADKNITAYFSEVTTEDGTISLTASAGNAVVNLAWSSTNITSGYEVYRDLDSDPTGRVRLSTVSANSYTDNAVSNGTTYYYWIKATDGNGNVVNSNSASATPSNVTQDGITIQENSTGFCGVEGTIDNNNAGFTGDGFANTTNSSGSGIDWAINGNGGSYTFSWNYANGSTDNRSGILYLNGSAVSTVNFAGTGAWTTWTATSVTISNVPAGFVTVRLEANTSFGLANIDYIEVTGSGVSAADCNGEVTTYALTTTIIGSGSINPSSGTYEAGTSVSMTATPASGWQFDNWSGGSTANPATVVMDANKNITAYFSETQSTLTATIQENSTGFCSVEGTIDNNNAGFTGDGFANTTNSIGSGINWAIDGNGGSYTFRWNYANGSTDNRTGILYLNGSAVSTEDFVGSGAWTTWTTTSVTISNVPSGTVTVRLEANTSLGLANIDYLEVTGSGVSATDCGVNPTTYTVSTSVSGSGSVSGAGTYNAGSTATLSASPASGWKFDNWSGSASGTSNPLTITVNSNLSVTANFSETTTVPVDNSMIGYATVNADGYSTTTGGAGGSSTTVSSLSALQDWASNRENNTTPEILYISGKISASSTTVITVKHGANVSILGLGSTAELQNIGINIWDYENVIVRNLKIHEVYYPDDGLTLDACNHVWVDHCELYSKIGDGITVDTYDGLLDIKRGSKYVTVSWCHFHDHMKTMLIGYTDNTSAQAAASEMRITLHHNYHQNTDGRNPSLRFGAVHMFNNYYNNITDYGLASRVGAHAKVENCHYNDVKLSMSTDKFPVDGLPNGYICQSGNLFTGNTGAPIISQTGCDWWSLPYSYSLDAVSSVASNVPANVGVGKIDELKSASEALSVNEISGINNVEAYPNPFSGSTSIRFDLSSTQNVSFKVFDMTGRMVDQINENQYFAGQNTIEYNNSGLNSGIYILSLQNGATIKNIRLVVE